MLLTMEETWKVLSGLLLSYLEDEEEIKARNAFASPSALAGRLGKRGGVSRASGQSKVASSRRCKSPNSDDNASDIFKLISGSTRIGKTNLATKEAGLAELASEKGIVTSGTEIVETDFGIVIFANDDCAAADDVTFITEAALPLRKMCWAILSQTALEA